MRYDLNKIDEDVLGLIPVGESRILTRDLVSMVGVSERMVRESIERLRKRVPIVASREKPFGLYIASDEDEFQRGIAAFENQAKTMMKNAEQLRNTHLKTWRYDLNNPLWRDKAQTDWRIMLDNGYEVVAKFELDGEDTTSGVMTLPPEIAEIVQESGKIMLIRIGNETLVLRLKGGSE